MAPISCDKKTSVEDFGVDADITYIRSGAFGRVGKSKDPSEHPLWNAQEANEGLRCKKEQTHWKVCDSDNFWILI